MARTQVTAHKRKRVAPNPPAARKRARVRSANDLPWKPAFRPSEAGILEDDGILDLEEVEGVEVVYEETEAGRIVRFNVLSDEPTTLVQDQEVEKEEDVADAVDNKDDYLPAEEPSTSTATTAHPQLPAEAAAFDSESLLPQWHSFALHPQLYRTLHAQQFTTPTPIQARALPVAQSGRDIVGVAETGSGKTLAYGLPILHHLLTAARSAPHTAQKTRRAVRALILTPTRELALQVSAHLNACLNAIAPNAAGGEATQSAGGKKTQGKSKANGQSKKGKPASVAGPKPPPLVSVAAVVGGMSAQKQHRVLARGVDVLVATPGRLWDVLEEDDDLARQIKNLRFLVLDEADRMVEAGHFAELDNILRLTLRASEDDDVDDDIPQLPGSQPGTAKTAAEREDQLQTFVFSATMSKDLQRNLKKRHGPPNPQKRGKPASTLDDLLFRLDFRDPEPEIIDLSPAKGVVATLTEAKIECLTADKDVYLYYFLLRYPGRSLVFLSSIDGIRRLMPLMELLNLPAFPLHSQLEQRQRLKNLERFTHTPHAVLLATDIAARGLDVPAVDHVVHYTVPRAADAYVHRNGRTARAARAGFSVLMCAPDERRLVRALLAGLGRDEAEIPEMAVELYMVDKLKARVALARRIDAAEHKVRKANHERKWMQDVAAAMEVELGSDLASASEDEEDISTSRRRARATKTAGLRAELKHLLAQPLAVRGLSTRYVTSGPGGQIVDDVLSGKQHDTMLGLSKAKAGQKGELVPAKRKKDVQKKSTDVESEEWAGIQSD